MKSDHVEHSDLVLRVIGFLSPLQRASVFNIVRDYLISTLVYCQTIVREHSLSLTAILLTLLDLYLYILYPNMVCITVYCDDCTKIHGST